MPLNNVLITGGNGNLGHLVADHFIAAGIRVISFDLPGTSPAKGVSASITGDIRDSTLLSGLLDTHKPDAIVHLASLLSGSSEADPVAAWEINATASVSLMHMAAERKIGPFVFASTIATYAPVFPEYLSEDAPQWPANVYGATKVAVERMGVWLKKSAGFDFRCLRLPMVLSPTAPAGAVSAYPGHAISAAANGNPFVFPVAPDTGVSTLYLDDVTRGLFELTLADAARLTQPAYNLHGFHFTAGQLAERIREHWPDADLEFAPDAKVDALIKGGPNVIDDTSARVHWGWEPAYDFDSTVAALIAR
ncbi:MAG: NAD-dependent epimerase/dehydratase family protein [Sulfitobacter sp.]